MISGVQFSIVFYLVYFTIQNVHGCPEIDRIINSLPYLNSPGTKCSIGQDCSSVQCIDGKSQKAQFSVGFVVMTCDDDPVIEINANIPTFGIVSWKAMFSDQTEKIIPGYFFPTSPTNNIQRQGFLKVSLQKSSKPDFKGLVLDLTLNGCEIIPEREINHSCTEKQIVNNLPVSCGTKKILNQQKICSLNRPFECGVNETCLQLGQSNRGECVCLEGLEKSKDSNEICSTILMPVLLSSTAAPLNANETTEPLKDSAALAVNIVVPILIVTLVAALLYAAFKHGLIHRMMGSFPRRRFETMTLNDNDDDDSPLA